MRHAIHGVNPQDRMLVDVPSWLVVASQFDFPIHLPRAIDSLCTAFTERTKHDIGATLSEILERKLVYAKVLERSAGAACSVRCKRANKRIATSACNRRNLCLVESPSTREMIYSHLVQVSSGMGLAPM